VCGIAGIVNLSDRQVLMEELRSMCAVMVHRGPDDAGYHLGGDVGLAMRRLSIIDLKTGHQPVCNETGSVVVVLNGEIYNYQELRSDLQRRGHTFRTGTDTETIAHLYEEYGRDCVNKLRGMFAFALWDADRHCLFVARDRLGIKPLYYVEVDGRLAFASELKALLQLPEVERRLNWDAVNHLFMSLATPSADSIILGVHKLEPGHMLTAVAGKGWHTQRYWDIHFEADYSHDEQYFVEQLREILTESVRLHLVSDVPVGAFLSGGVDSSAVVATMARLSSRPIKTFSIGFGEPSYDESVHARRVAERFGTDHHELILEPDITDVLGELAWHLDEPFGDSSAIPTYMVSKLAAKEVKVVMSGDGGDELFAGYDKYVVEARERPRDRIPAVVRNALGKIGATMPDGAKGRNFLRHLGLEGADRYLDASTLFKADGLNTLFRPDIRELMSHGSAWGDARAVLSEAGDHWLSKLQRWDLKHYLPLDILTKVDRMSMAHSLEARVPLLDHKFVEFAACIPPEFKLRRGETKWIFKRALSGVLPPQVLKRRKQGFAVPLGAWFRGRLTGYMAELLLSETSRRRGIFDQGYIRRLLAMHENGRNLDLQLWTLISFELWCRTFLDGTKRMTVPLEASVNRAAIAV
jgi:asparagine synthase (glutamine-hydrolysing)